MTKKKSNINWYFLISGMLLLYFGLSNNKLTTPKAELRKITLELSKDIVNVKGRKNPIDFKFWTIEYKNQFNILDGSITRGKHETIANLKKGEIIEVLITVVDYYQLGKSNEDITVMGISSNGNYLMSQTEFYKNRSLYKKRLMIFSVFVGFMLFINGIMLVPERINYAIIGIFAGAVLIMWILKIGIY